MECYEQAEYKSVFHLRKCSEYFSIIYHGDGWQL